VAIAEDCPRKCLRALESLGEVHRFEAQCKAMGLTPEARLRVHQTRSGPVREALRPWMRELIALNNMAPTAKLVGWNTIQGQTFGCPARREREKLPPAASDRMSLAAGQPKGHQKGILILRFDQ
jgi:hypothetical protein